MKNESNSYSSFGGEADILHSSFSIVSVVHYPRTIKRNRFRYI